MIKKKRYYINEIYLKKNRYLKPKENFLKLIKLINQEKPKPNFSLLDVGCANGELLFNLRKKFSKAHLNGIDVDRRLINKARLYCPTNIIFKKKSAISLKYDKKKFDYIICCGVLGIFKNGEKVLNSLRNNLKKDGRIFIFDSFNKYFFNLQILAKDSRKNKKRFFQKNIYSVQYIKEYYKKKKMKTIMYPFFLKKNLKINKKDFIYNWTETVSGKKIVTSGLGVIQYQYWLKIF